MEPGQPGEPTQNASSYAVTGALAAAAPVALAVGGLGGLMVGAAMAWFLKPSDATEIVREPDAAELAVLCQGEGDDPADALTDAQARVASLERDVANKARAVAELEAEMDRSADRGAALAAELDRARGALGSAQRALQQAEQAKDALLSELKLVNEELQVTERQRDVAREDALFNRWNSFVKNSQLEICDRGNRKKLDSCREIVEAAIRADDRRERFGHCIRSGQATPAVAMLDKGASMPDFAEMIDERQKLTRGWMILFCDPTLPEGDDTPGDDAPAGDAPAPEEG